jgi:hypothetical protein
METAQWNFSLHNKYFKIHILLHLFLYCNTLVFPETSLNVENTIQWCLPLTFGHCWPTWVIIPAQVKIQGQELAHWSGMDPVWQVLPCHADALFYYQT